MYCIVKGITKEIILTPTGIGRMAMAPMDGEEEEGVEGEGEKGVVVEVHFLSPLANPSSLGLMCHQAAI